MRENRKEPRKRTKEWAKIVLMDKSTVFNCTITDISPGGASLRVGDVRVPDEFYFYRKADSSLRQAVVKSRRYGTIGVQFDEFIDPNTEDGLALQKAVTLKRTAPALRAPWMRGSAPFLFADTGARRRYTD